MIRAKLYIYRCKVLEQVPIMSSFKKEIFEMYEIDKCIAFSRGKLTDFQLRWKLFDGIIKSLTLD